jgi:hypothetical protein
VPKPPVFGSVGLNEDPGTGASQSHPGDAGVSRTPKIVSYKESNTDHFLQVASRMLPNHNPQNDSLEGFSQTGNLGP